MDTLCIAIAIVAISNAEPAMSSKITAPAAVTDENTDISGIVWRTFIIAITTIAVCLIW